MGIHLNCDQSSVSKERINFVHDNSFKVWPNLVDWSGKLYDRPSQSPPESPSPVAGKMGAEYHPSNRNLIQEVSMTR